MRYAFLNCLLTTTLSCVITSAEAAPKRSSHVSHANASEHVLTVASPGAVSSLVTSAARRHGVPVHLAHGVVRTESQYNCRARSSHGALGVMQVMPRTARSLGVYGNLLNCETSIDVGMRYLKEALEKSDNLCVGLSFYNTGLYAKPRCTSYGRKVLAHAREYQQGLN